MQQGLQYWAYWEGPRSALIDLCLASLRRTYGVLVLDRQSFDALWRHDRDLNIDRLYVAHRADYIRAYLMRYYGGVWLDADCVGLRPLADLESSLRELDMIVSREPRGIIGNFFLIARAGTPTVVDFYERIANHLREQRPLEWLEIGAIPLQQALVDHPGRSLVLDHRRIMPVCWSQMASLLAPDEAPSLEADAYCYMLSNHSLPPEIKTAGHGELLSGRNLLGAVLRQSLGVNQVNECTPANYRYWQREGWCWEEEYERRKRRHPYLHITEMMLTDHVLRHAPCRVLEIGCGPGRQLRNLAAVPGADVHGFDQSSSMVEGGFRWAPKAWVDAHVSVGSATGPLPFDDETFDIVFTSEALLHTRPEDLAGRLAEALRVCRGHVLHLEPAREWLGYSEYCGGCWGHDYVAAYAALGWTCRVLPSGTPRQSPYLVLKDPQSLSSVWADAMLDLYRRLELTIEQGFSEAQVPAHA